MDNDVNRGDNFFGDGNGGDDVINSGDGFVDKNIGDNEVGDGDGGDDVINSGDGFDVNVGDNELVLVMVEMMS